MHKLLTLSLLFLFAAVLPAQSPSRTTIAGAVRDTSGAPLSFATVMLLNARDSTLVNFTRSNEQGAFSFKNVRNQPYLLKISYVGYLPYNQHLPVSEKETNDLGDLALKPISQQLMEVVVKAAKAPLRIHGDTIEYDASTFKVPPGSTVEDLLRRLPGIEVDADGNIRAQGRDVKRVYVDGKIFFSDDPKAATKNLGAETISKVQVYDEKTEQARITGVDDGKKDKAMNLELKEEYKKGSFGKVTAAAGTEDRWAARGNYNRFDQRRQISVIGFGNNINQTGINWEDYSEFRGQSRFSDFDDVDFGFDNGSNGVYYFGEDSPLGGFDGRGLTRNFGGGANFNYDHKKTKFNGSYFYNETSLDLSQFAFRQSFLPQGSFTNADSTFRDEFRGNHAVNSRFEHELDSNNLLIVKLKANFNRNQTDYNQSQVFARLDELPTNRLDLDNNTEQTAERLSASAVYRHRFRKKGRAFALSATYNGSQTEGEDRLFSLNRYFEATTIADQIRQLNTNDNSTRQFKSSLLFSEPLAKRWFFESFYNFSKTNNTVNRPVANPDQGNARIDSLSVWFDNDIGFNRLGAVLRYGYEGLNISAGVAGQQIQLGGRYARAPGLPVLEPPISRTFDNIVPAVELEYEFPNNMWLGVDYNYLITEPQINDLQPVPNVNNPAFQTLGNPNLTPERYHAVELDFNYWNPANFGNFSLNVSYNDYDNQIIYNQTIDFVDSIGVRTISRPDNNAGGNRWNAYLWSSLPIVKTKLSLNASVNTNQNRTPAFVNGVENTTRGEAYGARLGLSFTPNQKLILGLNGNLNFNNIRYSIRSDQNQNIQNRGADMSVKWQFAPKLFFESNFNYSVFQNDRFDFYQELPILNASVRSLLGRSNRIEMRLAAFDVLNRRVSISQSGSQNFVTRSVSNTLARYFMLSLSYNVRGYEAKIKKNEWF